MNFVMILALEGSVRLDFHKFDCIIFMNKTQLLNMSRLLNECLQQHSTPGVLPYDQIESAPLGDAEWTQSVQTPNPVALTEFPGRI